MLVTKVTYTIIVAHICVVTKVTVKMALSGYWNLGVMVHIFLDLSVHQKVMRPCLVRLSFSKVRRKPAPVYLTGSLECLGPDLNHKLLPREVSALTLAERVYACLYILTWTFLLYGEVSRGDAVGFGVVGRGPYRWPRVMFMP